MDGLEWDSDVLHVQNADLRDSWRNLAEIHAAPEWLWSGLVKAMVDGGWTVATTRAEITTASVISTPH